MDSKLTMLVFVSMVTLNQCVAISTAAKPHHCRHGEEYFSREEKACVPCSMCPLNTVPHRQCYGTEDTLCKPFGQFEFRQSEPKTEKAETSESDQTKMAISETAPEVSEQTATTFLFADDSTDEKWFTITMVLAGILVAVCVAGAVLLLYTCYMCKKKQREIIYDSGFAGSLLGYDGQTQGKMELYKIVTET